MNELIKSEVKCRNCDNNCNIIYEFNGNLLCENCVKKELKEKN